MFIKQLSVFVENKRGRLAAIADALGKNNIDISALSIADTTEFGILRMIVDQPERAVEVLKEIGVIVKLTDVIAFGIDDVPGGLASVLNVFSEAEIAIEYMYAFVGKISGKALMVIRVDNNEKAVDVIKQHNISMINPEDVYRM